LPIGLKQKIIDGLNPDWYNHMATDAIKYLSNYQQTANKPLHLQNFKTIEPIKTNTNKAQVRQFSYAGSYHLPEYVKTRKTPTYQSNQFSNSLTPPVVPRKESVYIKAAEQYMPISNPELNHIETSKIPIQAAKISNSVKKYSYSDPQIVVPIQNSRQSVLVANQKHFQ
jgi:hypothetical protein